MSILIALIALVLVALVVFVISAPLRAGGVEHAPGRADGGRAVEESLGERAIIARDELESAREAKYREIRDAELDYRTGKLSREDYAVVDGELRAEAIEILNRLEGPPPQTGPAPPSAPADGANRPALDENRPGADERDAAADGGGGGAVDGAGG